MAPFLPSARPAPEPEDAAEPVLPCLCFMKPSSSRHRSTGFPPSAIRPNIPCLTPWLAYRFPLLELFFDWGVRTYSSFSGGGFLVEIRDDCPAFAVPAPVCAGAHWQPEIRGCLCKGRPRGALGGAGKFSRQV